MNEPNDVLKTLAERARWYRDGCDGLEDVEGYLSSGDVARDAASDLETALSEIRVLERVIALGRETRQSTPAEAQLAALTAERDDLQGVLEDKRRLTRRLDVALHGENGAAKQASLCDLIGPAEDLRERAAKADAQLAALTPALRVLREKVVEMEGLRRWGVEHIEGLLNAARALLAVSGEEGE